MNLRLETGLSQALPSLKKEGILDGLFLVSTDRVFVHIYVCVFPRWIVMTTTTADPTTSLDPFRPHSRKYSRPHKPMR